MITTGNVTPGASAGAWSPPPPPSTPCAPVHDAPNFMTFCMQIGLKPICNHSHVWNGWCEHNYSLPIYVAFCMCDTYFWCAVTLVCVRVDALGVDWGSQRQRIHVATVNSGICFFFCSASPSSPNVYAQNAVAATSPVTSPDAAYFNAGGYILRDANVTARSAFVAATDAGG